MKKEKNVNLPIQKGNPTALIYGRTGLWTYPELDEQRNVCVNHCVQNGIEVYDMAEDDGCYIHLIESAGGFKKIMSILENQGKGGIPFINYLVCTDLSVIVDNIHSFTTLDRFNKILISSLKCNKVL